MTEDAFGQVKKQDVIFGTPHCQYSRHFRFIRLIFGFPAGYRPSKRNRNLGRSVMLTGDSLPLVPVMTSI